MAGGGGDAAPHPPSNGGEFLLSLLQKKPHHHFLQPPPPPLSPAFDPAVASMGPTVGGPSSDLSFSWPHSFSPPPPNLLGFHHANRLGFPGADGNMIHNLLPRKLPPQPQEHKLMFGSLPFEIQNNEGLFNGNSLLDKNRQLGPQGNSNLNSHREIGGDGDNWRQQPNLAPQKRLPPPGFPSKTRDGIWDSVENSQGLQGNGDWKRGNSGDLSNRSGSISGADNKSLTSFTRDSRMQRSNIAAQSGHSMLQFDHPGRHNLNTENGEVENRDQHQGVGRKETRKAGWQEYEGSHELDDLGEEIVDLLLLDDESNDKGDKKKNPNARDKDFRSDSRGQHLLSQRMRNFKRMTGCRNDIYKLNAPLHAIYESLIPPEEEKAKQRQLLTLLEKLVAKEWPHARLYLYGSCASTFGVLKSDIDVCLAIDDVDVNKSEVLLKLAEILESDNLENVQALTRARVPIVKLMDPVTGISCDICINNVLAVVNTKLLRDYAQIDVRLHQLAFIVKHWAKSRGVNATYQGTLSSYAYVLMCIHFLQNRRPAILPCLQGLEPTYSVTVDDVRCTFFDKVEKLCGFGSRNRESIAELVWGFFNYWAHCHDYANDVISIRTGSIISKRSKDWTRRVGNDRHLICIEDPFEISHDLGRVVDKYSIKVLREEFERAADIMQHDPNPCISLFEPYVAS